MPESRIEPTTVDNAETNARLAPIVQPVSPTGTPLLPQSWVRPLTILGIVCATVAGVPVVLATAGLALPAWVIGTAAGAGAIALLLSQLGIASPGARAPAPPPTHGPQP